MPKVHMHITRATVMEGKLIVNNINFTSNPKKPMP